MYLWLIFISLFIVFPVMLGLFKRIIDLVKGPEMISDYHEKKYREKFRRVLIEVIILSLILLVICLCWAVLFLEPFKNQSINL
jgi:hypothetical protein